MDPQATFNIILTSDDVDEIREAAENLYNWCYKGGFHPKAINSRGEPLPADWRMRIGAYRLYLLDGKVGIYIPAEA